MGRRKINIDMISELPDEVLHHILSFLPTYLSVSTSVLAKRWRFLWAHVPNLGFRGDDNHWDQETNDEPLNIIERFLLTHKSKTLNTFSLVEMEGSTDRLEALIIYAVEHSIRNLYLDFGYETHLLEAVPFALPRLLLTSKTLVDLKLDNCGLIPSSGEVFLPCLKKLDLSYVEYEDKESLPRLLSGCPVLEELIIKDACMQEEEKNLDCFIVSSPTIKTLNVNIHPRREVEDDELLIIDVPALVCLKVDDCDLLNAKNLTKTMDYLVEAEIHLIEFWEDYDMDCPEIRAFLNSLCHVRYLKISFDHTEEHVSDISQICSIEKFVNLTKLELDIIIDWRYVVMFLDVADNLEVLVFESDWLPYTEPKRVPTCMLSLRTVRINTFQYFSDGGFDMLKYILRNAKVLERMDIYPYCTYYDKENLVSNRSSLYERGSKSCQLTFNGHCESEFVI